jgi:hypothetical protein
MGPFRSFFSALFGNANAPDLHLGVFGKHPGWDDHMDDFGLDTEVLTTAKQILYNQGIGGAIDAGLWENPEQADALAPFGHWLFWRGADTSVFGRLWASSDRKGRSRYPMVVCLQFNRPLSPELIRIFGPMLEEFQKGCRETHEAGRVVQMAESLRQSAGDAFKEECKGPPTADPPEVAGLRHPACTPQEWHRLVFALDSQLARFRRRGSKDLASLSARLIDAAGECEPLRFPVQPLAGPAALLYWNRVVEHWVAAEALCLSLLPDNALWMDFLVGRPGSKNFFCLRASPALLPLTKDIPFDLPEDLPETANRHLTVIFGSSPPSGPDPLPREPTPPSPVPPAEAAPAPHAEGSGMPVLPASQTFAPAPGEIASEPERVPPPDAPRDPAPAGP